MTADGGPLTWVVGQGGLLGGAVRTRLAGAAPWQGGGAVPWDDPVAARRHLAAAAQRFAAESGGRDWQVLWCAGAGVTASTADQLRTEVEVLTHAVTALADAADTRRGALFLASSAGAVYAGSPVSPPYDERSPVRPLAAYGGAKLDAERSVAGLARDRGLPLLVGRISNLYGPGQNLDKAQGLVSQVVRAHLAGRPLSVYVSLDTVRDYLFAPDCARLVLDGLDRLRRERAAGTLDDDPVVTKVLASQRGTTIGALLAELRRVVKRTPRIVLGTSPHASVQARDLRMRSVVWPELDAAPVTPLPVGVRRTFDDLLMRRQQPVL